MLVLFVENFSGPQREEFFEKELPILVNSFEKIIVVPLYKGNHQLIYHHPRIEIKQFDAFPPCNRISVWMKNFFKISYVFLYEFRKTHAKTFYLRNFLSLLNSLILKTAAANKIKEHFSKELDNAVFYTYWFNQWTFILSLLKKDVKHLKLVSRVHGSDYKEEQINTILPFRYFQLSQVNFVFPVSEYAKSYLHEKFKVPNNKIIVNRLGIDSKLQLSPIDSTELNIVSCSSLIPLKRVHLIVQLLSSITIKTSWKHFGNGPEFEKIAKQIQYLPSHIHAELCGHIPNEDFKWYLQNNAVSFFINVSENEGLPVSLIEAAACGIPLIGPNVSGVPEIVNSVTGKLFRVDFQPNELAKYIEEQHVLGNIYSKEHRIDIQNYCRENFSSQTNFSKLAQHLTFN